MPSPFENPTSPQDNDETESMRKRVDALKEKETDAAHESPIYDLAKKENEIREDLLNEGLPKEGATRLAAKFSNETLKKLEIEKEGRFDSLTRLRNRTEFDKAILQFLSEDRRGGRECAILILDIDHFKDINDSFGHQTGDKVLSKVASIIKHTIRQSDWAYRYGGEEFVLILPNTDLSAAEFLAERIRKRIEETEIEYLNPPTNQTISIGIATTEQIPEWKDKDHTSTESIRDKIIKNADEALYKSKEAGRNKATVFNPEGYA